MKAKGNLQLNMNRVFPIQFIVVCLYEIMRLIIEERKSFVRVSVRQKDTDTFLCQRTNFKEIRHLKHL